MMKLFKLAAGLALAAMLTACGGGGGNPGTKVPGSGTTTSGTTTTAAPSTTTAVVTPASIEVLASSNELLSAGTEVVITAVVKNTNNVGMADQPVVFAVNNGATLKGAASTTNDDGVATARLSAGSKALREVTVTVTSGSAAGSVVLPVTGTRMSLTGAASLKAGDPSTYVARLVDSSGNPVVGQTLTVSSALGNGLSTTTLTTSGNGDAQFVYTASNAGTDTLVVSGAGTSARSTVAISSIDFIFLSPSAGTQAVVNTPQTISVRYLDLGVGQANLPVQFSTTRGNLSASSAITNGAGVASVTITSSSSGPANVVAQIAGVGQVTLPLQFIATSPATLVLQANPGAVLPNLNGNTNQSTLEAVVLDSSGNAVSNRQVNFTIDEDDGNGGSLSTPTALTDSNGRAQVQFIAGALATKTNGVRLRATVASTSVEGTTSLTVNGQALFISIGFGNTITNVDDTTYRKAFSVYVTDSNGNAVGNQIVTLSTIPYLYRKGGLVWTGTVWALGFYTECPNEDSNQNGILDSGEDTNTNGQLTPGNPVVIAPGTVTTDSQGRATFNLEYGEQYVPWLTVNITAGASVGGTESRSAIVHSLRGVSSDFSSETDIPAGIVSPFGTTQSCTSP